MSCRKVSHAFATLAGWPIADATNSFRSVAIFYHPCRSQPLQSLHPHCGAAHVATHPWRFWNDSHPQSFSILKGARNTSLIVRRTAVPLAISADLCTQLLKLCLDLHEIIVGDPRQRKSLRNLHRAGANRLIDPASTSFPTRKNRIENT